MGKEIIAIEFKRKITVMVEKTCSGLALIIGAIAAIAVPPQIAVPTVKR